MAPTLTHEKSGRQVTVPEDAAGVYLENGWSVAGKAPAKAAAVEKTDGDPNKKWTVKQLKAYAASHKVDLGDASNKGDILAAIIADGGGVKEGTDAGSDSGEGGAVPASADGGADNEG